MMMDLYRFGSAAAAAPAAAETSVSDTKECPVCHARLFSDMDVCYGCLHSFASENGKGKEPLSRAEVAVGGVGRNDSVETTKMVEFPLGSTAPLSSDSIADALSSGGYGNSELDDQLQVYDGDTAEGSVVPTVEMHITEGQQAAIRLGQILQVVISVQVAQDACRRREVQA